MARPPVSSRDTGMRRVIHCKGTHIVGTITICCFKPYGAVHEPPLRVIAWVGGFFKVASQLSNASLP